MSKHALPEFVPARIETSPFETGTEGQLWERIEETADARLAALPPRDREELRDRAIESLAAPENTTGRVFRKWREIFTLRRFRVEPPTRQWWA